MKRILIDEYAGNIVGALSCDNRLLEYECEKSNERIVVGSIYLGRVENVLNGMNASFVNIGLEKNGYLFTGATSQDESQFLEKPLLNINDSELKIGDNVIVQVIKDTSGTKGVRLSTYISFAGRNLVYMPNYTEVVVSRKIEDENTKNRLIDLVKGLKSSNGGFIVRTASVDADKETLLEEIKYLESLYQDLLKKSTSAQAPTLLYEEGNLAKRLIRDVYTPDVDEIIVNNLTLYNDTLDVAIRRGGVVKDKIKLENHNKDLISMYGLNKEVDSLLRNKVMLSSGAYINIDRTEALTSIDVNTGKYIGEESLEQTVFETNLKACEEIARQIRLRNIGGIIIIDLIDMEDESHKEQVLEKLKQEVKNDRARCNVLGMTSLGLIEMTRKKSRKESTSSLVKKCPYCKGDGVIFSNDYIVMKIRVALLDLFSEDFTSAIVDLNMDICDYIFKSNALSKDAQKIWKDKRIYLVPHKTYHQEFFIVKGENKKVLDLSDSAKLLY